MGYVFRRFILLWSGVFKLLVKSSVGKNQKRLQKMKSFEWIGQTIASICWITSVFVYANWGIGDWLQLFAASSWLFSNIAAILSLR